MATVSTTYGIDQYLGQSRFFEKCRIVEVPMADIDDADTYTAGPGLLMAAWESTTADTGEVTVRVTSRAAGTIEFDCAGSNNVGSLWLFYGVSGMVTQAPN